MREPFLIVTLALCCSVPAIHGCSDNVSRKPPLSQSQSQEEQRPEPGGPIDLGDLVVPQVDTAPTIDGNLDDWDLRWAVRVQRQRWPGKPKIQPEDLTVRTAFAFDLDYLYVAVLAVDDVIETRQRAWRYGDGFILTIGSTADGAATRRFVSFGFPYTTDRKPHPREVNRDGKYFPRRDTSDIRFAVHANPSEHQVTYEIAIPYHHLDPFRPLVHQAWGVNLTYVDKDSAPSSPEGAHKARSGKKEDRKWVQLVADPDHDTEATHWRRVRAARVVPRMTEDSPQCQAGFQRKSVLVGDSLGTALGCVFSGERMSYRLRATLSNAGRELAATELAPVELSSGWTVFRPSLDIPAVQSGTYSVRLTLLCGSEKVFSDSREILVVGEDLVSMHEDVDKLMRSGKGNDPLMPSLDIRFQWIRDFLRDASPAADPAPLAGFMREADTLLALLKSDASTWTQDGVVFRFAHRSFIDGRLQPYSVFIPKGYDRFRPPPLLVDLHGSGVDEKATIRRAAKDFGKTGWLILAPQARGLSDFYLGPSGDDVIESIEHLKTILPFDRRRVFLRGFSMGGYGAWRLSLLHPRMFSKVAVLSGCVRPRRGENNTVADLLSRTRGPRPSYLVVHGARDNSVSIEPVRQLVGKLRELGIAHEYIELPDAAHGNYDYDVTSRIIEWFKVRQREPGPPRP
jgi:predicted esterase